MKHFLLALTTLPLLTYGQANSKKLVDSLKYVTDMPYICETTNDAGCGDILFWTVVKGKQTIIPSLLDKLTDTTTTKATVPNFGGQWTVADIAYSALKEIVRDIPTFDLLGITFDTNGCGYCSYWTHLRKDIKNRMKFQAAVKKWYNNNKANLVWVNSNEFSTCDCSGPHPNGGHFALAN